MKLARKDLEVFRDRFYDFADGVVCGVELTMRPSPKICRIRVTCKDRDAGSGWSDVCFDIHDVLEYRFAEGKTVFEVLSSGIQFAWRGNTVYVVLDAYPDDEGDLPDLVSNTAYVAGRSCEWSVGPHVFTE